MGRKVLPWLVAAVALGLAVWLVTRSSPMQVLGVVPLADEGALVLGSRGSGGALVRVDGETHVVWSQALANEVATGNARHGVAVHGELIFVQLVKEKGGRAGALLLNKNSGDIVWTVDGDSPNGLLSIAPWFSGADTVIDTLNTADGGWLLRAHAVSDGRVRWERTLDQRPIARRAWKDGALVRAGKRWLEITNTKQRSLPQQPAGDLCVVGEDAIGVTHRGLSKVSRRDDAPDTHLPTAMVWVTACGTRRNDLVVMGEPRGPSGAELLLQRVAQDTGEVKWSLRWAGTELDQFGFDVDRHQVPWHSLRGALTRAVPFIVGKKGSAELQLVVVDVDAGRVLWESKSLPELVNYSVTHSPAGVHYVHNAQLGHIIAIDATSGKLLAAVKGSFTVFRSSYATAKRLWVAGVSAASGTTLPVQTLEPRTLKVMQGSGLEIRDARGETGRWLGAPPEFHRTRPADMKQYW